jgi:hypothetical protein
VDIYIIFSVAFSNIMRRKEVMKVRKESICLGERTLLFSIGGQLFDQAPNRQPRKAETIMTKVRDAFRGLARNDNEYYSLILEENELNKYIKNLLMAIPEFQELNLSQVEYEKNISVDDENRPKYSFSSRYDKETTESWRTDFIDLDAFIRNVVNNIWMVKDFDTDCFCCIHKDTEECKSCSINSDFKIKYEGSRAPKGKYTFACKYDCYRSRYICCEECDDKNTCNKRCVGNSKDCGIAINRIYK